MWALISAMVTVLLAQAMGQSAAVPPQPPPSPQVHAPAPLIATECSWIAAQDVRLKPLVGVCEAAWSMRTSLPNFICDQTTHRSEDVMRRVSRPGEKPRFEVHRQEDVITAEVTYRDGDEEFNFVALNGRPATADLVKQGTWTRGEFSPLVMIVLGRESKPALSYRGERKVDGTPVWAFEYAITQENNHGWSWTIGPATYYPQFHGEILVERSTGRLRRLVQQASDIPAWLGLKSAGTGYGLRQRYDRRTRHLPPASKVESDELLGGNTCVLRERTGVPRLPEVCGQGADRGRYAVNRHG